ncbi:MAG TPA: hypothetical protein VFZ65_10415 [Planctomycetota bacterium]|nr:hypothetical protein [Planctomycetota bacterium]
MDAPDRPFPSEAEWLDPEWIDRVLKPGEFPVSTDFVERTLQAIAEQATATALEAELDRCLPAAALRTFTAPEPSADFVASTLAMLRQDRRARWRELLARHVAPEPSPQFVARTLTALDAERDAAAAPVRGRQPASGSATSGSNGPAAMAQRDAAGTRGRPGRRWGWVLLTAAAATVLWVTFWRAAPDPIELRLANNEPDTFAHAYAASPLPAVLATLANTSDPYALPSGEADGVWLLLSHR